MFKGGFSSSEPSKIVDLDERRVIARVASIPRLGLSMERRHRLSLNGIRKSEQRAGGGALGGRENSLVGYKIQEFKAF